MLSQTIDMQCVLTDYEYGKHIPESIVEKQ